MIVGRIARDWFSIVQQHGRVAALGFAGGALALLGFGTLAPKQYRGSALIALNLPSAPAGSAGQPDHQRPLAALLQQEAARQDWSGIASRYRPNPEVLANHGLSQAATLLASQVEITPVAAPGSGGEEVRISYGGRDRGLVSDVTEAVAEGFTKPLARTATRIAQPAQESLYAPVILPDIRPLSSRSLRRQRGRSRPAARTQAARGGQVQESAVELASKLQASLAQGKRLQEIFNQNTSALDGLQDELTEEQKGSAVPAVKAAPPPRPATAERRTSPQEEKLKQDLAKAQLELAGLRDRYTEEFPDVVAAKQKVQDIQLDMSRIAAATPMVAKPPPVKPQPESRQTAAPDTKALTQQIGDLETVQSRLQDSIERNHRETARLQLQLATAAGPGSEAQAGSPTDAGLQPAIPDQAGNEPLPGPTASAGSLLSPFFLVQHASVVTQPWILATTVLWPLSLVFGILVAFVAAWIAERRDPSIRNENMLRHELPASAVYLGRIPRIRHEVIAD